MSLTLTPHMAKTRGSPGRRNLGGRQQEVFRLVVWNPNTFASISFRAEENNNDRQYGTDNCTKLYMAKAKQETRHSETEATGREKNVNFPQHSSRIWAKVNSVLQATSYFGGRYTVSPRKIFGFTCQFCFVFYFANMWIDFDEKSDSCPLSLTFSKIIKYTNLGQWVKWVLLNCCCVSVC